MTGPRKVDNKNPMRHKVLRYLREHPKELKYIIGDYLAKHPEVKKLKKRKQKRRKKKVK